MSISSSSSELSSDSEIEFMPRPVPKMTPAAFSIPVNFKPRDVSNLHASITRSRLGIVSNVHSNFAVVKAISSPVLDTGSSLFVEDGSYLGEIYETFGPVLTPYYVVVFPSQMATDHDICESDGDALINEPISNVEASESFSHAECTNISSETTSIHTTQSIDVPKNITVTVNMAVFYVPDSDEYTIPVFYNKLVEVKGSDASWVDDIEAPPEALDFSDDEKERQHKRALKMKRKAGSKSDKTFSTNQEVTPVISNKQNQYHVQSNSEPNATDMVPMHQYSRPYMPQVHGPFGNQSGVQWIHNASYYVFNRPPTPSPTVASNFYPFAPTSYYPHSTLLDNPSTHSPSNTVRTHPPPPYSTWPYYPYS